MVIILDDNGHKFAETDTFSAKVMIEKGNATPTDDPRVIQGVFATTAKR